ncbi:hypothetical protein Scep_024100 [Stephania cephalantha]|uniref:Uncharacterized protein n=1 Tax=Stephania cephalantha TaxID=152367 RepID=A0AAP0EYP6_9MAGN
MGAHSSQQQNNVLVELIQEVKGTLEFRLDRIEDFLVSIDGRLCRMSEAFSRTGGDVGAGLETLHKDMDNLMKRANEVARKAESSRKITKEFVEIFDPSVIFCIVASSSWDVVRDCSFVPSCSPKEKLGSEKMSIDHHSENHFEHISAPTPNRTGSMVSFRGIEHGHEFFPSETTFLGRLELDITYKSGVPIIAMPMHIDQPMNARLVVELCVGLEAKRVKRYKGYVEEGRIAREVTSGSEWKAHSF